MASPNEIVAPTSWDSFIGQEKLKRRLLISIEAANNDLRQMGHILLAAQAGYGKTTLARLIAQEMGAQYVHLMMPIKKLALQKNILEGRGVLGLDELHRLKKAEQEELLLALEEGKVQLATGEKVALKHPLTIIGMTTELQDIIPPLRDRFHHQPKFELYSDEDMALIVQRMASKLELKITDEQAMALGKASAGVPRQARIIIFMARDLGTCDPPPVLETVGITPDGLTENHVHYMMSLDELGRLAGIDVISNHTGIPKDILLRLEKLLVRKRYVTYSPRGREMTLAGALRTDELRAQANAR